MAEEQQVVTPPSPDPVAPVESVESTPPVEPAPPAPPVEPVAPAAQATPPPETPPEPAPEPADRVVPAADGYTLPEGVPQDIGQFAHDHGFTQEQLDSTIQQMGNYMQGNQIAQQNALRSLGEAHLKNWGENADYNLSLAKRALQQNDTDGQLAKALNDSGYGNHPAVLNFLYNLGQGMKEGGFLKSAVNRPPGERTAAQAMYGDSITSKGE